MADTEIILNDCFKTKRAKVSNIAKCFKNAVSQTNNPNKETLTFSLNDLCILRRYEGNEYKDVAYYNNELYPDPTDTHYEDLTSDEYWSTIWQPNLDTITNLSESTYVDQATKISNYPGTDFPELKNITGYHIACLPTRVEDWSTIQGNWNGFNAKHFSKGYSDGYKEAMYSAEVIEATFTIAIPSVAIRRNTILNPNLEDTYVTNILDYDAYPESLLQNNPVLSQRNYITIGSNPTDSIYNTRFVLFFDNITKNPYEYIKDAEIEGIDKNKFKCKPGVYLVLGNEDFVPANDNNFVKTKRYKIPDLDSTNPDDTNWDGNSLKTFKFSTKKINGNIKGTLKIINDKGKEILIADNIDVTSLIAVDPSSSQFGQYSQNHITNFIIKDLYYKIKPTNQYNFVLQTKAGDIQFTTDTTNLGSTGAKKLIDHFVDYYKYSIGTNSGTNSGDVYWFNGLHTQINDSWITLQNNLFDEKLHDPYFLFQKKDKEIKVIIAKNLITAFENPGKNIYKINLSELESLDTLDLSGNELTSIDLSNNIHLQNINLSNNINLTEIIWPKGLLIENKTYNINLRNTSINIIEFTSVPANPKDIKCKLDLKIDSSDNIIKLNLQGISLINPDNCDVINAIFTNVKEVNISETNILSKKTRLEKFLNNLPDRSGKEPGIIYMYGKKYTSEGVQGSAKTIKDTLENLKNKNWLFYL